MTDAKGPSIGAIGRQVVANMEALRMVRGYSFRDLAARLAEIGRPILPSALHAVSQHKRRMDADDLVAVAIALGVNPNALLLPHGGGEDDLVELTPDVSRRAWTVWEWADGRMPLPTEDTGTNHAVELPVEASGDYLMYARPAFQRRRRSHPAVQEVEALLARLLLMLRQEDADDGAWREAYIRRAQRRVELAIDEMFDTAHAPAQHDGMGVARAVEPPDNRGAE